MYNYVLCFDWYFGLRCLEKPGFVTPANVVEIFHENDVPKDFDMLSLDTDGFEWLLWLKLQKAWRQEIREGSRVFSASLPELGKSNSSISLRC